MGQQQLLMIVLGIIIVAVAIAVSILMFSVNAVEAKRNNITGELVHLSTIAQSFYARPLALGGGGRSFVGWVIPSQLRITANGSYRESVYSDSVVINGIGNEVVTGNDSVQVKIAVFSTGYKVSIIR